MGETYIEFGIKNFDEWPHSPLLHIKGQHAFNFKCQQFKISESQERNPWAYIPCMFDLRQSWIWGFPGGSDSEESGWNARDLGLMPGSGRSPGEGNGYPLQYSHLENPMDRGSWLTTVHGGLTKTVGHDLVTKQQETILNTGKLLRK